MKRILTTILITLIIILSILLYSRFLGVVGLNTHEIVLKENIPDSFDGFKIVHFADIHYKKVITEKEIKNLIREINRIKPDIVFFTGDLIDHNYKMKGEDINFLIQQLSKIESKFGIYAVLGDQDMSDLDTIRNIYLQSNVTLLENVSTVIQNEENEKIFIGGLGSSITNDADIHNTMSATLDNDMFQLILVHEPDYSDTIIKNYSDISLILSSHSINGSINIPILKRLFLPVGSKKYFKPFYSIGNTKLYITNGIGVNRFNFRFFNHPSINYYKLKKKD